MPPYYLFRPGGAEENAASQGSLCGSRRTLLTSFLGKIEVFAAET